MLTPTDTSNWRWQPVDLAAEPACCPDPFASYFVNEADESSSSARTTLKKHMAYLGWKMESRFCGNMTRMRYISPDGKCYYSLYQVCRAMCGRTELIPALSSEDATGRLAQTRCSEFSSLSPPEKSKVCKDSAPSKAMMSDDSDHTPANCPQAVVDYHSLELERCLSGVTKELRSKVKQELLAVGWTFSYRQKEGRREMVYTSPRGTHYFSLRTACRGCIKDSGIQQLSLVTEDHVNAGEVNEVNFSRSKSSLPVGRGPSEKVLPPPKTRKALLQKKFSRVPVKPKYEKERTQSSQPARAVRSDKKLQKIVPMHLPQNPKTVLSWLMDNDTLLPRTKVYCHGGSSCSSLTGGWAHRDGIRCSCCNEVFTLSGFVSHSGGNFSTPAARVFVEDGRSLLDSQVQILKKRIYLMEDRVAHNQYADKSHNNDHVCSICHYGGNLILCDQCPSSFHNTCLGLKDVPDGDWFCPSCCCGICGDSELREDIGQHSADVSNITCYQCEHHTACLMPKRTAKLANRQRGNWFCSKKCEQIHEGLLELEGKQVKLDRDDLTLTFLKPVNCKRDDDVDLLESAAENYVKLNIALDVMHECFEPVIESHSCRDLIEDVIFNRGSELNRLNFRGFYTVLLEKNDELITVAIIRIRGKKVAEVPLVGTRFQFRRLGMCHAVMNALEKKLKELGVERITLPAAPSTLNTWTGSFGFKEMTELERLQLVNYTLLNFQDAVMCQKRLLDAPSEESTISSGDLRLKLADHLKGSPETGLEGSSTVSEEFQGEAVEGSETIEQGTAAEVRDADGSSGPVHGDPKECKPPQPHGKQSFTERFPEGSITDADSGGKLGRDGSDRVLKCRYQRRRLRKDNS